MRSAPGQGPGIQRGAQNKCWDYMREALWSASDVVGAFESGDTVSALQGGSAALQQAYNRSPVLPETVTLVQVTSSMAWRSTGTEGSKVKVLFSMVRPFMRTALMPSPSAD